MKPMATRVILHVDMNSFYASVEQAEDPSLKNQPVAVAGNPRERRGIIVTCSYEARDLGVYTTMTVGEAKKKAPSLIIVPVRHAVYRSYADRIFETLREITPLVEPVSIDEAYLDITAVGGLTHAVEIASTIQHRLKQQFDLPCSIGIGPNKFLAKTASDWKKPMGITVLRKRQLPELLWPLPLIEMHGIGERTATKLEELGMKTIGDLAQANDYTLRLQMGKLGMRLYERANGIDYRPVDPEAAEDRKSIGSSTTLVEDTTDRQLLFQTIGRLAQKVAERLEQHERVGYTLTVQIRYHDWEQVSKRATMQQPIVTLEALTKLADELFTKLWTGRPVRLVGVTLSDLELRSEVVEQLTFETYEQYAKEGKMKETVKQLQRDYGEQIIRFGKKG